MAIIPLLDDAAELAVDVEVVIAAIGHFTAIERRPAIRAGQVENVGPEGLQAVVCGRRVARTRW